MSDPAAGALSDSTPQKPSRAGRNLGAAVGVGLGLAALAIGSLVFDKRAFVVLAIAALALGHLELRAAFGQAGITIASIPVLAGGSALLVAAYAGGAQPALVVVGVTLLAVMFWRIFSGGGALGYVKDTSASVFTLLYAHLLAAFAMLLLAEPDGVARIVTFILVTVCSDIGGYLVGVVFGKHPMAPTISPKKSWEGFFGSATFCIVAGVLSVMFLLDGSWWVGALLGVALVLTATMGDLAESLIKRDLGIKDMGDLLPGHGGMMDRLDSLLPCAMVSWALLTYLVAG